MQNRCTIFKIQSTVVSEFLWRFSLFLHQLVSWNFISSKNMSKVLQGLILYRLRYFRYNRQQKKNKHSSLNFVLCDTQLYVQKVTKISMEQEIFLHKIKAGCVSNGLRISYFRGIFDMRNLKISLHLAIATHLIQTLICNR